MHRHLQKPTMSAFITPPKPVIQLLIFDLDGTLVDSAPDIAAAVNRMRAELGYPEKPLEQVKQWVGNGSAMLVKRALGDALQLKPAEVPPDLFEKSHELFFKHYRQCNGNSSQLYPGVVPTLKQFQLEGIQQAICTNKPAEFTHALLKKLSIDHFFRCVVSGDTLPVKKPDPAPLLFCAKQCDIALDQCVMVGDSMTDVNAAKNAGMNILCVGYGYHRGDNLATECEVIKDFSLLPRIVAGLPH